MSKKRILIFVVASMMAIPLMFGCATAPTALKESYFEKDYEMTVDVTQISEMPQMMDSGGGGLIGLMVSAGRASEMRKKMEGIKGSTVSELLRQTITAKLEDYFEVVDEDAPLATEIGISRWGWYVPTTVFGIKTGSYQFRMTGSVIIYDQSQKGKKEIVSQTSALAEAPLGNDPTKDNSQEALLKAIDDFTDSVVGIILQNKK